MARKDQEMRKSEVFDPSVDIKNTGLLKKIIRQSGWPTTSLVGKKASNNAWLIAQHADCDLKFQKLCLKLIKKAVLPKNVDTKNVAYLTDRILVSLGKKQIYGTQFYKDEFGKLVPRPIKEIEALDKRRRNMNLGTFENYKKKMEKL